ncbi:hypothetical protein GOP47_0008748 [Adiantum capillus-veneris]|uniref:GDSL esterase/lipase n=1 Tax=Adiantum capillus-veneris TaxID=13818 RepID=A0A9D4UZW3_ADICA|nr:hypothetical protein GOP47_0008748 [Adiantum capillus-veneris]
MPIAVAAVLMHELQQGAAAPCYPAIFVFGDSLSDTDNGVLTANPFFLRTAQRPYGETVPGNPAKPRSASAMACCSWTSWQLELDCRF